LSNSPLKEIANLKKKNLDRGNFTSNEVLVEALRRGEPKAYEEIYHHSLPSISNLVCLNSGQEEDAEDLLQEALIIIFRKLQQPTFVLTCNIKTYLYSICRNKWLYHLAKRSSALKKLKDFHDFEEIPDDVAGEQQDLRDKQLQEAFTRLDEKCQQILIKYYFYNQSLEDIAKSLENYNVNAVKVKKFRCIQKLKNELR
jgi:RNA polymerase sigma factor (sigma-70 family)